jgi:hypothetical protein
MKVGIEVKIDVTKIDKSQLYIGKKGKYLTMTAFLDTENEDQYKYQGRVYHADTTKEDNLPILGNAKVFWFEESKRPVANKQHKPPVQDNGFNDSFGSDIPF